MEKGIKIIVIIIFIALLFLLLFNLNRWFNKKGFLKDNKANRKNITNKNDNKDRASDTTNDPNRNGNTAGYIIAFSTAIIYTLHLGKFGSFDHLDIAQDIGSLLGVLLGPAIISAIINSFSKKNNFGEILAISTILIVLINLSL